MKTTKDARQYLVICITGTPGVGKTSVSEKLAALLGGRVIDVRSLVVEEKLFLGYDKYRDTYIVNENALKDKLRDIIGKNKQKGTTCIVDTHLLGALQDIEMDLIVVLTCDPLILFNRVLSKGLSFRKAAENAVSEFLNQILLEVFEIFNKSKIMVIDTSCKSINEVATMILDKITSKDFPTEEKPWKQANWSFRTTWISRLLSSISGRT